MAWLAPAPRPLPGHAPPDTRPAWGIPGLSLGLGLTPRLPGTVAGPRAVGGGGSGQCSVGLGGARLSAATTDAPLAAYADEDGEVGGIPISVRSPRRRGGHLDEHELPESGVYSVRRLGEDGEDLDVYALSRSEIYSLRRQQQRAAAQAAAAATLRSRSDFLDVAVSHNGTAYPPPRRRSAHVDDDPPPESPDVHDAILLDGPDDVPAPRPGGPSARRDIPPRIRGVFACSGSSLCTSLSAPTAPRVPLCASCRVRPAVVCSAARSCAPHKSDPACYRPQARSQDAADAGPAAVAVSLSATLPAKLPCCCGIDAPFGGSPNGFLMPSTPSPGSGAPGGAVPPEQLRPGWTRTRAERTRRRQRRLSNTLQAHKEILANNNDIPQDGKVISNLVGEPHARLVPHVTAGEAGNCLNVPR
ncbi:hypothetical protein ONE63_000731 [Megalurothrips usitatus]|uniref:Uncharacterized protein n=1 Tax=Megalurothrips usitatus TaxID=439358 RepID=A0AAV7Y663_9NEOP|nr:hypothetical protein ONE63_000731 [Megalurothrips usitatus]